MVEMAIPYPRMKTSLSHRLFPAVKVALMVQSEEFRQDPQDYFLLNSGVQEGNTRIDICPKEFHITSEGLEKDLVNLTLSTKEKIVCFL
ncbi:hypothetical protein TNCV_290311 [Trichonephila clavipes]|nr:hypothetical protein TNCV_290311 [Trichonephila clavipes]